MTDGGRQVPDLLDDEIAGRLRAYAGVAVSGTAGAAVARRVASTYPRRRGLAGDLAWRLGGLRMDASTGRRATLILIAALLIAVSLLTLIAGGWASRHDPRSLLFVRDGQLVAVPPTGDHEAVLGAADQVAGSPDGLWIAVSRPHDRGPNDDVWVMRRDGTQQRVVGPKLPHRRTLVAGWRFDPGRLWHWCQCDRHSGAGCPRPRWAPDMEGCDLWDVVARRFPDRRCPEGLDRRGARRWHAAEGRVGRAAGVAAEMVARWHEDRVFHARCDTTRQPRRNRRPRPRRFVGVAVRARVGARRTIDRLRQGDLSRGRLLGSGRRGERHGAGTGVTDRRGQCPRPRMVARRRSPRARHRPRWLPAWPGQPLARGPGRLPSKRSLRPRRLRLRRRHWPELVARPRHGQAPTMTHRDKGPSA